MEIRHGNLGDTMSAAKPEDRNNNGIADEIEPPIHDISGGRQQLADRLKHNPGADPTLSGGDVDARWEDAESGGDENGRRQHGHPGAQRP